jgi:hypothetical protein
MEEQADMRQILEGNEAKHTGRNEGMKQKSKAEEQPE